MIDLIKEDNAISTTIPKSATRPIIPGKESGCRKRVRPTNTPMREEGSSQGLVPKACTNQKENKRGTMKVIQIS